MSRWIGKASWWPWLGLGVVLAGVLGIVIWPMARAQVPEPNPQPLVRFSTSNYAVGEGDGSVTITVTLSASSTQTVTVDYATSDGTATGSTNGGEDCGDYAVTIGTLTFLPGETSKTIVVEIYGDFSVESNETFTVTLSNPSGGSLGSPSTSTVTIVDDDTAE